MYFKNDLPLDEGTTSVYIAGIGTTEAFKTTNDSTELKWVSAEYSRSGEVFDMTIDYIGETIQGDFEYDYAHDIVGTSDGGPSLR